MNTSGIFRLGLCILLIFTFTAGLFALGPAPAQAISITAVPSGNISVSECQPFSIQFSASGLTCTPPPTPFYWAWGLPSYANLDANTGLLTGCPKVGDASATFMVAVSEFSPPFCGPFTSIMVVHISVVPSAAACGMVIDPTFYPVAWEGMPFFMPLSVTGGVGPYFWSVAGLPPGLSVTDAVNGVISGIPAPAACGIYTVTATVADNGTCCCTPVSRPFILIVDCWTNYPGILYDTTECNFNVAIGPGLTSGLSNVTVDGGALSASLPGGGSKSFISIPCQSHMVLVDQTVPGPDARTRYTVKGPYYKLVTDIDNYAYFDYAQEVLVETAGMPAGIANPPGSGFYAVGSEFRSVAPSPVSLPGVTDTKYIFRSWVLPDGSTNPNRDLVFKVTNTGTVRAEYDTFYLLTLKSDSPPMDESSWELKDSTAQYNLALQPIPMKNFWGLIGGVNRPVNAMGSHVMTGPYTQVINWAQDYTIPIVVIIFAVLVVFALASVLILLIARSQKEVAPAAAVAPAKMASTGAGDAANFCSKCGAPVEKDAVFCKKCGNKIA